MCRTPYRARPLTPWRGLIALSVLACGNQTLLLEAEHERIVTPSEGALVLALTSRLAGLTYHLNATVEVVGASRYTLTTAGSPSELRQRMPAGNYTVELSPGFSVHHTDAEGAIALDSVQLLSDNPQGVSIEAGLSNAMEFAFALEDEVLQFGEGELVVQFDLRSPRGTPFPDAGVALPSELNLVDAGDDATVHSSVDFGSTLSAVEVSAGFFHTCARTSAGDIQCWGSNVDGQLGDGSSRDRSLPVASVGLRDCTALSVGAYHSCARCSGGQPRCWGYNLDGQLGDGTQVSRPTPVELEALNAPVLEIAAGESHNCALLEDRTIVCWGDNEHGQLGAADLNNSTSPIAVADLAEVDAIATGYLHNCAQLRDGSVRCWGNNERGQLGNGGLTSLSSATAVQQLSPSTSVVTGLQFSCALLEDSTVACWGGNASGQLGNHSVTDRLSPVSVSNLTGAIALSAGRDHACALVEGGQVLCWGNNVHGQIGDGTLDNRNEPVTVSLPARALSLSVNRNHSCAVLDNFTVWCWGRNDLGQLGNGSMESSSRPVLVAPL